MIGKLISQLLGGGECEEGRDALEEVLEFEEGGWVVVSLPDVGPVLSPEAPDPLEDLRIQHPGMCVYQMSRRLSGGAEEDREDEGEDGSDEDEENASSRLVTSSSLAVPRLAAWGLPLASGRGATAAAERRKLSRGALLRQNLTVKTRRSPAAERRVKQPSQRPYNY
ncbi:tumor protein p53-inducible nuclear protein 2 [Phycodurus eques]|uniref:tumor protein p53-inducible nuclear protein 2 n=1 Tax=Phycodurus eques TaxID=693459 RepID=UPI002ACDA901|nr:tumor protein p53-inducible nuclear protein 2 [Phycodurus eques]